MDPDTPPEVINGSYEAMRTGIKNKDKESDHYSMEQMSYYYYRYGIKPEWMQVHRIINHYTYAKVFFPKLLINYSLNVFINIIESI
jgi:hypothetical protein